MKTILDVRLLILFAIIFFSRAVLSVKFVTVTNIKAMSIINTGSLLHVFVLGDYIDKLARTVAGLRVTVVRTHYRCGE